MSNSPSLLRRLRSSLAIKLVSGSVVAFFAVALALSLLASDQLNRDLTLAFRDEGQAIAISLASAAERSAVGDPLVLQNAIAANGRQRGVRYLYVTDGAGQVVGHTFTGAFPAELATQNALPVGGDMGGSEVHVARVDLGRGAEHIRAIDVVAPVARGTLGAAHVGMDSNLIDAEKRDLTVTMLAWGAGLALAGVLVSLLIAAVAVIRPIRELTRVTGEIVEKGDLAQSIRVGSTDEVGELAGRFAQLVTKLREIPLLLQAQVSRLGSSVTALGETAQVQSQTVARQAAALQETQVTAQEIKQTSMLAAQKAEAVLKYAEQAESISQSGEQAVGQSLGALTDIRSQVEEIARRITELGALTQRVGSITQSVKDLADQSNMLALNAAIEAVRSGEAGKGFGVVAREIRSLADQSVQATRRVSETLDGLSLAVRQAVEITGRGSERIELGLTQVKSSGDRIGELTVIVRDNAASVRQISAAVGQQSAGITQIFGAVSDQNEMMHHTVTRLESTNLAVKTLEDVAQNLARLVGQFRV